jgi:hypothetical protein
MNLDVEVGARLSPFRKTYSLHIMFPRLNYSKIRSKNDNKIGLI